ncbi:MAG TPA: YggS family pyridoxal phosphate-dependent enzyme [Persephonella sp.]|uniref:Pyridoxal phosphate homeostasis protein n=1 Tax=Persephonella marina (strain DSM 14350 / EX-H1) TaxID=123214 RepID=C0QT90_PERMH|nr:MULTISPECIES: YggS family pyridoxal phosphate-dependent enzyme [Persephonella]ACO04752.1 pyridoxal phosphate enzyme, YggS family [Persephonella marina EX-H1]HCB70476.1 YggS family pyridoxal phosphate-dependent enzyme [Persephonella sp.]
MSIRENVERIREIIYRSAERSGRDPEEIILLAASKTQPVEKIKEAYEAGVRYFGENRVQEGIKKIEQLKEIRDIHWHLIGGLQTNKAKYAVRYFELIHSLDRESLADELDKRARKIGKKQDVLIEVNIGEEETKYGVKPENLEKLFEYSIKKENIRILGLMCIPPYFEDKERSRPYFVRLREMKEKLERDFGVKLPHLSMGMSHDFDVAVEEGATIVRIGTAIFGERE